MLYTVNLPPTTYRPSPRAYGNEMINGVLAQVGLRVGPVDYQTTLCLFFPVHECVIGIGFQHLAEFPHWSPDLGVRLWMTKTKGKQLAQNLIIKQQTKYTIFLRKFKKLVPVKQTNKQNLKTQD